MIGNDWDIILSNVWNSDGYKRFWKTILDEYKNGIVYPPIDLVYNALKMTPYSDVKVVIVGQDPYHGENEAHGLSFSVPDGVRIPPSLQNIFKELHDDLGYDIPLSGNLTKWAENGVLLLNSILTVKKDMPASHRGIGWELLTDYIIRKINAKEEPVVFILWGNYARSKKCLITNPNHLILESVHPSPFSVNKGFWGSKPFSKTNEYIKKKNLTPVDWRL